MASGESIDDIVERMQQRIDALPVRLAHHRAFPATYRRTIRAVGDAVNRGGFEDPAWVERWDAVFAGLYLSALDAELDQDQSPPRPWRLAFDAPAELPALRQVLLGINAHINYDLPQALIGVISDTEFDDPAVIESRRRDHERIDGVVSTRVSAEDAELGGRRTLLDRALTPFNRQASRRFLREARQKVWHNTLELQAARLAGPGAYARRLAELELLSAAKITDLIAPGQVLLRLAVAGFGVTLPPPA